MSAIEDLAAMQHRNGTAEPGVAVEKLGILLDLPSVGLEVRAARVFGQGSRASVEIEVSNGETMAWDTIRDMARPASLAAEVVACTGACPSLKQPQAFRVVALVRALAEHETTFTDNQIAAEWGLGYLQAAKVLDVDMSDQRDRWGAFDHIGHYHEHHESPIGVVLRHIDGDRFVRAGWFLDYVRRLDPTIGQAALSIRMVRVGWRRRGKSGRIKASAPNRDATLAWNFWVVAADWEDDE